MKASQRISSVPPSATVALNTKAKAMKAEGIPVTSFAVGEPDFATPPEVVEVAIASLKEGRTKYGAPGGGLPLRQAISQKLQRENQLIYDPQNIVVGSGSKEILFHAFLSLLNDGDEVLIPAPFWVSYSAQVQAAGGVPVIMPIQDDPAANLAPDFIAKYVTNRTVGIVINFPNNPSGFIPETSCLKTLAEYIDAQGWWVISDEIYEYLCFDQEHQSMLSLCPSLQEKTILINGLSKGFAMTGWRVGYGAGPASIMKMIRTLQSHSSTCIPGFIEDAAQFALEQGKPLVAEHVQTFKRRRDKAVELLRQHEIPFLPPHGAFYAYLDLRSKFAQSTQFKETSSLGFSEWLLEKYHIAAAPGEAFGTPGFLRLSYAVEESLLEAGIKTVAEALKVIT